MDIKVSHPLSLSVASIPFCFCSLSFIPLRSSPPLFLPHLSPPRIRSLAFRPRVSLPCCSAFGLPCGHSAGKIPVFSPFRSIFWGSGSGLVLLHSWFPRMNCRWDFLEWLGPDASAAVLTRLDDPEDLARVSAVSWSWRKFGELPRFLIGGG